MNKDRAISLLAALGEKTVHVKPGWVVTHCPFAPFRHAKRRDSRPSFGLRTEAGQGSGFHCFACGSGQAAELVQALEMYVQNRPDLKPRYDFVLAHRLLDEDEQEQQLPGYKEFGQPLAKEFEEWPWHYINSFLPLNVEAVAYLAGRGVPPEQMAGYHMRWDYKRRMIVMPYENVHGRLAGARGRAIDAGAKYPHWDYTWNGVNNAQLCWYNERVLQLSGPVVVVEGQFDCLRVARVYQKVVANMTALPSQVKLQKLLHSPKVVHLPDNDGPGGAGDKSIEHYRRFCNKQGLPYECLPIPLPKGDSKIDPADCAVEYLEELLAPVISA